MALLRILAVLSLLAACSSPDATDDDATVIDVSVDATTAGDMVGPGKADTFTDVGVVDATTDASDAPDAPADEDAGAVAEWQRFETTTGETFEGELIAVYDTARWWNPLDGLLYAVFDPSRYAPYPNDRSLRFVNATELAAIDPIPRPVARVSYVDFLRQAGMLFRRPPLAETSYVITGNSSYHLDEDGFGDFAWDIEKTDEAGRRFTGTGAAATDYLVWDEPVLSGVRGEVIEVVDTGVDNVPGSHPPIGTAVNNLVGIALGGSYYAYYLHFREGGVEPGIVVGAQVDVGDTLGRVGNSGVTLEPHMHMVLLWFDVDAGRSYSVPAEFAGIAIGETPLGPFEQRDFVVPATGSWLRAGSEPN